ncbi:MAG: hypothetical protein NZ937_03085 [Armatimonadetes bacterium]|nr:hypothetical protein [Armatimonadota bacterium]
MRSFLMLSSMIFVAVFSLLTMAQKKPSVSYTKEIQPLLTKRCTICHGEKMAEHDLRLDRYEFVMKGDKEGPVVVPGKSDESRLFLVVSGKKEPKMPPEPLTPLTPSELELLKRWINEGAKNDAAVQKEKPKPPKGSAKIGLPKPQRVKVQLPALEGNPELVVEFGPVPPLSAIAFSPESRTLFVGGYKEVVLWDLSEAKIAGRWEIDNLDGSVTALANSKDGKQIAVAVGNPQQSSTIAILDATTGKVLRRLADPKDMVYSIAISPDGKWLTAACADKIVYVWDLKEGKLVTTLKEHGDWALGVDFNESGNFLATSSADKIVRIWEVGSWKVVGKMEHPETTYRIAFQPKGNLLAVAMGGESDRGVWIWNLENKQRVRTMAGMNQPVLDVAWSADGKWLVAAVADNTVRLYDANGNLKATLQGHNDWVNAVAFHPDNLRFASASNDGTIRLWHVDGRLLAVLMQLQVGKEDWLVITPQGYFAGTKVQGQLATKNKEWQNHELVKRAIAGEKIPPAP